MTRLHSLVDWVIRLHGVHWMAFSSVDNLLCVIQKETSEHYQSTIQCDGVETGPNGCCSRQEPSTYHTHTHTAIVIGLPFFY